MNHRGTETQRMLTAEEWGDPNVHPKTMGNTFVSLVGAIQADALRAAARECENQPTRFAVRDALLAQARALEETR